MPETESEKVSGADQQLIDLQRSLNRAGSQFLGRSSRPDKPSLAILSTDGASANEQLRNQLATAQAEAANLKSQWLAVQRAVPSSPLNIQREAQIVQTTSQLRRLQRDLASERLSHKADAEIAATNIGNLQQELAAAKENSLSGLSSSYKLVGAGVAAGAVILLGLIFLSRFAPTNLIAPGATTSTATPIKTNTAPRHVLRPTRTASGNLAPDFTHSLSRLNEALASVPGRTAQEVLRDVQRDQANAKEATCAFAWTDAGPALLFGKDHKGTDLTSLSTTLNRCAEAIEQSR